MIPLPVTHFLWQGGRRTRKVLPRRLQNCGSLRAHVLPQRRRWFTSCASVKIEVQICPFSSAVQGRAPFSHTGDRPQIRAVIEARQIMQIFSLFTARSGRVRGYLSDECRGRAQFFPLLEHTQRWRQRRESEKTHLCCLLFIKLHWQRRLCISVWSCRSQRTVTGQCDVQSWDLKQLQSCLIVFFFSFATWLRKFSEFKLRDSCRIWLFPGLLLWILLSGSSALPSMFWGDEMCSQSRGWVLKLCLLLHFSGVWYLLELQHSHRPEQLQTCFFFSLFFPTDWIREEGEWFLRRGSFQQLSRSQYTTQQFHTTQLCGLR